MNSELQLASELIDELPDVVINQQTGVQVDITDPQSRGSIVAAS